jgi:putative pyruvate formate lyase activating enzyme
MGQLFDDRRGPGCSLCPRLCGARRSKGEKGYCGSDGALRIARASLHAWEEPPLTGAHGSGAVFFSNCPLRCVYCQNGDISLRGFGADVSTMRLAEIMLELQAAGAANINLVTATQYTYQAIEAVAAARRLGLALPIVWNSSGYERVETIHALSGTVDAYLMDFRYSDAATGKRYSSAPDYCEVASEAIIAAVTQVGEYGLDAADRMRSGMIVRFLLLPGMLDAAVACVDKVYAMVGDAVCYSLLCQYTPPAEIGESHPELSRQVRQWDYDLLIDHVLGIGVRHSFMQDADSAGVGYIPAFDLSGVALASA